MKNKTSSRMFFHPESFMVLSKHVLAVATALLSTGSSHDSDLLEKLVGRQCTLLFLKQLWAEGFCRARWPHLHVGNPQRDTHAQTCDNVRVQSATEWAASVTTVHMPTPVITFLLKVLPNRMPRCKFSTCPSMYPSHN